MVSLVLLGIVLGIVAAPARTVDAEALARFERLQHQLGHEVVLIDATGLVMEGRLLTADDASIQVGFGGHVRTLLAGDVARVDRARDSSIDGLVKGLVIGTLFGVFSKNVRWTLTSAALYGGIGYTLDQRVQARETIYRAPAAPVVQVTRTIRW